MKKEIYMSVDIEANGPIPGPYSMSSVGACVVGSIEEHFYIELKPLGPEFIPEAVKVSGLTNSYLEENGVHPQDAMLEFDRWVRTTAGPQCRPVFVAFNATFDWMFVYWYLIKFVGKSCFSISGLDIKSYYMGMSKVMWGETTKRRLPSQFRGRQPHTHNALDDAIEQAMIFERMQRYNASDRPVTPRL